MTFYQENENIYISILILEPDFEKLVFSPVFQKVGGAKKDFPFSFSFSIFSKIITKFPLDLDFFLLLLLRLF
jgi:hypothetical protein